MTGIATEEFKMTELGPIPCDWEIGTLGSGRYFQILPSGIDNFTDQKKYLSTSSIQGWKIESPECLIYYGNRPSRANMQPRLNTVWFAKMIGSVKVYCFTESNREEVTEYILSTGFCGIRCKEDVDTEYLKFIFLSDYFNTLKDSLCSGATQRAINNDSISSITIAFPPLPEQKKIAYFLSTVQTAIEKTEAVIKATRALKKSLMKHLFTYGPVSIDEAKNVPLKETEIGMIPEEWEVVRVGHIAHKLIGGGTPSTSRSEYWGGEIQWTTSKRITGIHLVDGEKRITSKGLEESATHLVPKGNLIIGTRVGVGKVAVNEVDVAISQDLTGAIINSREYVPEFLAYQISTDRLQRIFAQCMRGTTIKGIPRDELVKIPLGIPPYITQKKIADAISAVDTRIEAEENKEQALEALFKTLLTRFMTGKIRVSSLEVPV